MDRERSEELRRKAEEIVKREEGGAGTSLHPVELQKVIQELHIHQIELEAQNEELRQIQQQLELSRLRYSRLFENAPVGYVVLNTAGIIRDANREFLRLTGERPEKITGAPFADYILDEDQPIFRSRLKSLFKNPEGKTMDVRFGSGDKIRFYGHLETVLQQQISSSSQETDHEELLITISDMTSQRKSEEKIQKLMEDKELLLKEAHHRIKNNMSTVSSLLSLHSDQTESREAVAALKDAIGRVESMKILYDKLYKTESYRSITVQDYLYNLIDEIYRLFPSCQHIKINRNIEDIEVDANIIFPLGIILNELLTNAMKHAFNECSDGEMQIEIKKEKEMLHVRFADNGSGFEQELLQNRESFGLQLIDMLVDQLSGTYSVTADAGCEYVLKIPL